MRITEKYCDRYERTPHQWEPAQTGCAENPGVHGSGHGQVVVCEVCACGATRSTDYGATGSHGQCVTRTIIQSDSGDELLREDDEDEDEDDT